MEHSDDLKSTDPEEELVRLIAQAQRRLYAFIFALVRRAADADDVLQETNVVLWRKRETFRLGTDFYAWAFEIARFQVLAYHTRQGRHSNAFDAALLADIADAAQAEPEQYGRRETALRSCLQKLTERQRSLIVRRYQPEVAVNSLAVEMGEDGQGCVGVIAPHPRNVAAMHRMLC